MAATATKVVLRAVKFDEGMREHLLGHLGKIWERKSAVVETTIDALKRYSSNGGDRHPNGVSQIVAQAEELMKMRRRSVTPEEFVSEVERTIRV